MTVQELKKIVSELPDDINHYDVIFGYCCAFCPVEKIEEVDNCLEISI